MHCQAGRRVDTRLRAGEPRTVTRLSSTSNLAVTRKPYESRSRGAASRTKMMAASMGNYPGTITELLRA